MSKQRKPETLTTEEMTRLNTLTINALIELLNERGVLSEKDLLERIRIMQARDQVSKLLPKIRGRLDALKRLKES